MSTAINHHYVSQLLLKNFSPDNKPGLIHIFEKPDHVFLNRSIAEHTACKPYYNTLELNGQKSNVLEEVTSQLESKVGRIFKKIKQSDYNLTHDEWSHLLYFGAFLFLNTPQFRDNIEWFKQQVGESIISLLFSDKEMMKQYLDKIELPGIDKSNIDLDKLISFGKEKKNTINIPKEDTVFSAIKQLDNLFKILARMYWNFYIITDDSFYITSGTPIVPVSRNYNAPFPGFANADIVTFPLTKKVCLVGQWIGKGKDMEVQGDYVNGVNLTMMKYSTQIYSPVMYEELIEQFKHYV